MFALTLMAAYASLAPAQTKLVSFRPNVEFPVKGQTATVTYDVDPGIEFDEGIASWNVENADGANVEVQVRAKGDGVQTKWYTIGQWSLASKGGARTSVKGQKDGDGNVDTDTFILAKPAQKAELRLNLTNTGDGHPKLKLVTFAAFQKGDPTPDVPTRVPAWGQILNVPQRAQGSYPNGGVLCSPTSLSMVLWHYGNTLNRPELNRDVPEVEDHVWDTAYAGAGNWPFNTAYAGSFKGLTAYVTRFGSISDLEKWIDAGYPVICSVAFSLIQGLPLSPTESGHLVVLVGFSHAGDPIFNDPAQKDSVRKTYKRADFEKAWLHSSRTVYLVYPDGVRVPGGNGMWIP